MAPFCTQEYSGSKDYDYGNALSRSIEFLDEQRSGRLSYAAGQRNTWRGNSALTEVPNGGWYHGGDNLKLTLPIAVTTGLLAWSILIHPEVCPFI